MVKEMAKSGAAGRFQWVRRTGLLAAKAAAPGDGGLSSDLEGTRWPVVHQQIWHPASL
jgi:hypothetical protein